MKQEQAHLSMAMMDEPKIDPHLFPGRHTSPGRGAGGVIRLTPRSLQQSRAGYSPSLPLSHSLTSPAASPSSSSASRHSLTLSPDHSIGFPSFLFFPSPSPPFPSSPLPFYVFLILSSHHFLPFPFPRFPSPYLLICNSSNRITTGFSSLSFFLLLLLLFLSSHHL